MASSHTNRALWLASYDEAPSVKELPIPEATSGTVVIRVLGTSIPSYTRLLHEGKIPNLNISPPYVPNANTIGRVHAVGPDAVYLKVGDLVYGDATVRARDDPSTMIMAGHIGAPGLEGQKLVREWRDGSLQQFQRLPLENIYRLDEQSLLGRLGYTPPMLAAIAYYSIAAGALLETAHLTVGETVAIGPSGGAFGGLAVEMALTIGASVVALGRNKDKLAAMRQKLNNHPRLASVVMTGDKERDTAEILKATPGGKGADVYNDWSPGEVASPPFLSAAIGAVKMGGRVVLSGGSPGNLVIPYNTLVLNNIKLMGKWMCSRETLFKLIKTIEEGQLKIGTDTGSQFDVFSLDEHEQAVDHAAKNGAWRQYTVVAPNGE
ncbi:hypothetical protein B0J13DRAFT_454108 [Dactylonectria estremocensis]|uniref:Alcohol dehydrogenase-like C-terminal domain-containing protein n=1 Tax=Dactylonectria estremocensis TaxID=1079267 RepID=A0A9P9DZQ6_9HYPO|nr:hypothetical protein B0J13DRAFT_454108 [Dactylonectria estremocensis]